MTWALSALRRLPCTFRPDPRIHCPSLDKLAASPSTGQDSTSAIQISCDAQTVSESCCELRPRERLVCAPGFVTASPPLQEAPILGRHRVAARRPVCAAGSGSTSASLYVWVLAAPRWRLRSVGWRRRRCTAQGTQHRAMRLCPTDGEARSIPPGAWKGRWRWQSSRWPAPGVRDHQAPQRPLQWLPWLQLLIRVVVHGKAVSPLRQFAS